VPTIFVGLLNTPGFAQWTLGSSRVLLGAAPLAPETLRDLKELTGATMSEIYG